MYRHIPIKSILDIKYYAGVPIDSFKRFTLPSNDIIMREADLYKLTYLSIKREGLLDPMLCYDLVNVDLDNPPLYRGRKIWGALLIRGNIRWLACKDLGINIVNAVVARMDYGCTQGRLFLDSNLVHTSCKELKTAEDINSCFVGYNPQAQIFQNHIDLHVPALVDVKTFNVHSEDPKSIQIDAPTINYAALQLQKEHT